METALKVIQMMRLALLVSIGLYVFVGETVFRGAHSVRPTPNPLLFYVLTFVATTIVALIFIMRRVLATGPQSPLAGQSVDASVLNRWRTGHIMTYALSEAIALFGLVLRMLGFSLSQVAPFYVAGFVLLLFFSPRLPSNTIR